MSVSLKTIAASAALSLGLAFSANAHQVEEAMPTLPICEGQMFGGDYLAVQSESTTALTKDILNLALQDNTVAKVEEIAGGIFLIMPTDPNMDCNDFMDRLNQTGLVNSVEPNWIVGIGGPGPDFY